MRILSWLVETFTNRKYSHIFVVLDGIIYHSDVSGIDSLDFEEYKDTHDVVGEKDVTLHCGKRVFLDHHAFYKGLPYRETQVLGFIPFFGRLFKNGRKGAWCSEYVSWVLNDLGRRWEFADGDISTPAMFDRI